MGTFAGLAGAAPHHHLGGVNRSVHPGSLLCSASMSTIQPRIAIVTPRADGYSETFIAAHIERLPGVVRVLVGASLMVVSVPRQRVVDSMPLGARRCCDGTQGNNQEGSGGSLRTL